MALASATTARSTSKAGGINRELSCPTDLELSPTFCRFVGENKNTLAGDVQRYTPFGSDRHRPIGGYFLEVIWVNAVLKSIRMAPERRLKERLRKYFKLTARDCHVINAKSADISILLEHPLRTRHISGATNQSHEQGKPPRKKRLFAL